MTLSDARQVEAVLPCGVERLVVAGIGMPHDACARIGGEHALESLRRIGAAVGEHDHARVDRVADPDAAAVVDADPRRARRRVQERVQDRPVGDRIGAVAHRLGLAVGRGDRTGVEVVASDHDRRRDGARANELVDREACLGAVAVAEPADPRRQPLEGDALGSELQPAQEQRIVGEQAPQLVVDHRDVGRVTREGGPPEGADAATEERPDIGRDEARV